MPLTRSTRTAMRKCTIMLSLFDLAPGGVYHAVPVASNAVRSYRTISPLPDTSGGLFSAALSIGLRLPAVSRRRISVEPGLSSIYQKIYCNHPTVWQGELYT